MLVLKRNVDEEIVIGNDIVITLVSVRGDHSARIGIQAPRHIPVHRREIQDRIDASNASTKPKPEGITSNVTSNNSNP